MGELPAPFSDGDPKRQNGQDSIIIRRNRYGLVEAEKREEKSSA